MSAQDEYFDAIHRGLNLGGYHVVWPPGKPVTLGAIGNMVGRAFDARGHVEYGDVFVNGMIVAESGAAAVSASADATIALSGRGDVAPGGAVGLFSLKAGISIADSKATALCIPMSEGCVLAIRLVSLDKKVVFKKAAGRRRPVCVSRRIRAVSVRTDV